VSCYSLEEGGYQERKPKVLYESWGINPWGLERVQKTPCQGKMQKCFKEAMCESIRAAGVSIPSHALDKANSANGILI